MTKTIVAALLLCASVLRADELSDRVNKIASTIDATVGVSAMDLDTGRRLSIRGCERFQMASVYKFPIALAVLKQASTGAILLDREIKVAPNEFAPGHSPLAEAAHGNPVDVQVGRLLLLAVGESDNTASDVLLRLVGGPQAVMQYLRFTGISGIDVSRSEKQLAADRARLGAAKFREDERDTATPDAMALLFRMFSERAEGLTAFSRNFLIEIMRHSKTGDRRIRAGVPGTAEVLDKTGTMGDVLNDAALVKATDGRHRIVIVVFTKGAKKSTEKEREAAIAAISREIYDEFTKRQD